MVVPLLAFALFACADPEPRPDDTAPDEVPLGGEDLDETTLRDLGSDLAPPAAFDAALAALGLSPDDLSWPDQSATFARDSTRLHWTDEIRHAGANGPVFAGMVAADVTAALDAREEIALRELLVAAGTYLFREDYTVRRYDERPQPFDGADPLLAALEAFYVRAPVDGGEVPEASWDEIEADMAEQVATLPEEVREPIALALQSLTRAAELRDAALTGSGALTMDDWAALHDAFWLAESGFLVNTTELVAAHDALDFDALLCAGELAVRAVETLRLQLAGVPPVEGAGLDLTGPLGRVRVDFGSADSTWDDEPFFLLVDRAGNDTYIDNVAATTDLHLPVAAVLDLDGDDTWTNWGDWTIADASISVSAARNQGFGLMGIAIVDDAAGDDRYHSAGMAQGTGVFGVGVLADHGGDDVYQGYYGAQGHAQVGLGLLADLGGGADRYETLQMAQGYGGPRGIGWAVDDGGNDSWLAIEDPLVFDWAGEGSNWSGAQGFGFGVRDGWFTEGAAVLSGGLGGLFDLDGDDAYQCAVMCQGFGYFFGTGLFWDPAGDDTHLVTHKYAQGGATHYAVGLLVDGAGDDIWRNDGDDECTGIGYDASVAWHMDLGDGADTYAMENVSSYTVGVTRFAALGVLVNEGGDDVYDLAGDPTYALGRSEEQAGMRSGYLGFTVPAVAVFLDLGGTDSYPEREDVGNDRTWIQDEPLGDDWTAGVDFGYGLDAPAP